MAISAEIVLDSIGANGSAPRLTTWRLTLPRYILAELNTHRKFSRNCPSSRAIPVMKRIKMAWLHPVIPIHWGLDQGGMSASAEAAGLRLFLAKLAWRGAAVASVFFAFCLTKLGIHKQVSNRVLETYVEVTDLVTATQDGWENWFALRAEGAADPHIQRLAYLMLEAYNKSIPKILKPGEWHIPYGDQMPGGLSWEQKIKVAVARCARVSYNQFDGSKDVTKDFALHDRLAAQGHWSSFEHIAKVPEFKDQFTGVCAPNLPKEELEVLRALVDEAKCDPNYSIVTNYTVDWTRLLTPSLSGNLTGWVQLRKTYPNECRRDNRVVDYSLPENMCFAEMAVDVRNIFTRAGWAEVTLTRRTVRPNTFAFEVAGIVRSAPADGVQEVRYVVDRGTEFTADMRVEEVLQKAQERAELGTRSRATQ